MKLKSLICAALMVAFGAASVTFAHSINTNTQAVHSLTESKSNAIKVTGFHLIAPAQADEVAAPSTPQEAIGLLPGLIDAVKQSKWGAVAAILLMLLVFAIKTWFLPKASADWAAFLAAALPVAGMLGASLYSGKPVGESLLSAVFVGAAASGFWEQVGKRLLKLIKPKATATV